MFKRYRDSIKRVVTLAKIQSTRKAFHDLTLMDNCQTFYSKVFVFDGTVYSMVGGEYF